MPILDLITILLLGLLIGNELAVSLFVNPALWKLAPAPQAQALSLLARVGGKVMPPWYMLCFALLIAEAWLRRHVAHAGFLYAAVLLWALVSFYSVTILVPINNQIARLNSDSSVPDWRSKHVRWDTLHRWRVLMITAAMACLVWSIVARP